MCVLLKLLGFVLEIVCAHVWYMQVSVKCLLKQLNYTYNVIRNNVHAGH
jgi:hypothetical protein